MITADDQMWELSPKEAVKLQRELAAQVILRPLSMNFRFLGASDLTYLKVNGETRHIAVLAVFSWPDLALVEMVDVTGIARFPYVPGLLSFREAPPLLEAWQMLRRPPDVLLCDGQGLAHPRKLGLACHLGLCLGIPTVGCAKTRLCGDHGEPAPAKGSFAPLSLNGEIVGAVFRSRDRVKPLYVSPGHLCDVGGAVELVSRCVGKYRIPDPQRLVHNRATELRRACSKD